jgi:hypothetical protein
MEVSYILEMEKKKIKRLPVLITETLFRCIRSILPKRSRNGAAISKTIRESGGSFELPFSPGSWIKPGLKGAL